MLGRVLAGPAGLAGWAHTCLGEKVLVCGRASCLQACPGAQVLGVVRVISDVVEIALGWFLGGVAAGSALHDLLGLRRCLLYDGDPLGSTGHPTQEGACGSRWGLWSCQHEASPLDSCPGPGYCRLA